MLKKIGIFVVILIVGMLFMLPSGANPTDVMLDQQVELGVPGVFESVDLNQDGKAETLKFIMEIRAYQVGGFMVTANLEGLKNGHWLSLGTTAIPFDWSPDHKTVELNFNGGNIRKAKISGPYRVTVGLKQGDWELPSQVAGFSSKYSWDSFSFNGDVQSGEIKTLSAAKRAVETWAQFNSVKLGNLVATNYDYDHWQLDYKGNFSRNTTRFLVSPKGSIQLLTIKKQMVTNN